MSDSGNDINRMHSTAKWMAEMFGEMIYRGYSSDEHIACHDRRMGDVYMPSLPEMKEAYIGLIAEKLYPILEEYREKILADYEAMDAGLHAPNPNLWERR